LSLLAAPTFLGLGVVGVSPKAVIQLLFVAVEAGATAGQAVHLGRHRPILHVAALGVEVGHVPSILLVIVVVSVGAVMGGGDALGVGSGGAIVEVGGVTMSHLSAGAETNLLLLLGSGGPDTDHPHKEDQQDQEDDSPGDSSSNVGKLRLGLTVITSEGSDTLTVGVAELVLQTRSLVSASVLAHVSAVSPLATAGIAELTFTRVRVIS